MRFAAFYALTKALPEPLALVDGEGHVLAGSLAGAKAGIWTTPFSPNPLEEFVADSPERLRAFLERCRRTAQPALGVLDFRRGDELARFRCGGSLIDFLGERLVLLRLTPHQASLSAQRFHQLNHAVESRNEGASIRRHSERAGREDASRLHSLVSATQDAVVFITDKGKITQFNPSAERVFGYQESEVVGKNVRVLMPEPYHTEHDGYLERYERTGEPRAIGKIRSVQAQRKNGEVFPIELSVTEVRTDHGVSYAAFIRDISETVRLQIELNEKQRLASIGTTAATLAHEVGNPLNNMRLQAQLAEKRTRSATSPDEGVQRNLRSIIDEISRLSELLEEFRTLSKRENLRLSRTDVRELIAETCRTHQEAFAQQGVTAKTQIEPDLPLIRADSAKLKQVVLNLCKNAIEAMPGGGALVVTATSTHEAVTIEVSDTGLGIPEGVNVFEPFITTKEAGTGLGLSVARRIAMAHGGRLTFESQVGKGTTFRLCLPLTPPPTSEPPATITG